MLIKSPPTVRLRTQTDLEEQHSTITNLADSNKTFGGKDLDGILNPRTSHQKPDLVRESRPWIPLFRLLACF